MFNFSDLFWNWQRGVEFFRGDFENLMINVLIYFAIYNAIICKEADTRLNVFVDVIDVQ